MKYIIEQQNKPTLPSHGKYRAKAVHQNTIDTRQLIDELARRSRSGLDESIIKPVLIGLSEIIKDHLRNGDRVKLDEFGLMKLEISSEKARRLQAQKAYQRRETAFLTREHRRQATPL